MSTTGEVIVAAAEHQQAIGGPGPFAPHPLVRLLCSVALWCGSPKGESENNNNVVSFRFVSFVQFAQRHLNSSQLGGKGEIRRRSRRRRGGTGESREGVRKGIPEGNKCDSNEFTQISGVIVVVARISLHYFSCTRQTISANAIIAFCGGGWLAGWMKWKKSTQVF